MRIRMIGLICACAVVAALGMNVNSASARQAADRKCEPTLDKEERIMLRLINEYRAQNKKPKLDVSIALTCASKWMSTDMATRNYFNHKDSLGRDPFKRMSALGYDYRTQRGENIAADLSDAERTFNFWKTSPGHNATMLKSSYIVIGISRARGATARDWYWTTDFGGHKDALLEGVTDDAK